MNKLILTLCMFIMVNGLIYSQTRGQHGGARSAEMMKQGLKYELKFSDLKTDSVTAIQQAYQAKSRRLRMNESLSDDEKRIKLELLEAERKANLGRILTVDELQKLDAYLDDLRKKRLQTPAKK